jgi:hypothetical protein
MQLKTDRENSSFVLNPGRYLLWIQVGDMFAATSSSHKVFRANGTERDIAQADQRREVTACPIAVGIYLDGRIAAHLLQSDELPKAGKGSRTTKRSLSKD